VRVPEIPDRTFPGKVTRIANALQPGSRTLLTEIDIPNPDGALTPGIYCTIELHILHKTPSYKVSADAIIFNEAGLQVAVVENDVVHLRKVAVVRDLGQEVEVNSGVKRGDWVISIRRLTLRMATGSRSVPARLPSCREISSQWGCISPGTTSTPPLPAASFGTLRQV
jgi:multidrug efflux pump subunit AcrA (membrane-fusion protein)